MKALTFELSGRTAFFKKPDANAYAYFTYANIHKIALLGLLGAVMGLNGYRQQEKAEYPEFYEKLHSLKTSIVPITSSGHFARKIQVMNNTSGFGNRDVQRRPCTLNYREQWLFDPKWQIYVMDDSSDEFSRLSELMLNRKCEFIPYLGKNDHPAVIMNCKMVELDELAEVNSISSLFPAKCCEKIITEATTGSYHLMESLPVSLRKEDNSYQFETFTFTNLNVEVNNDKMTFYKHLNKVLYFM